MREGLVGEALKHEDAVHEDAVHEAMLIEEAEEEGAEASRPREGQKPVLREVIYTKLKVLQAP